LDYLIKAQRGSQFEFHSQSIGMKSGVENALGSLGLLFEHATRLREAYEQCDYLDLYQHQASNHRMLPGLELNRRADGIVSSSIDDSGILNDWTWHELGDWLTVHRCLFVGAEAQLQSELLSDSEYLICASKVWAAPQNAVFLSPPRRGQCLAEDLDRLKAEISDVIARHKCDTLLLSLGGAAKVIGYELSLEMRIRVVDFGSMLRALTYSGSAGNASWRAAHNPFFFHVPFMVYMRAVERAWPELSPCELVAKAQAQVCLELQRKELGRSFSCDVHDPTAFCPIRENMRRFWIARGLYQSRYVRRFQHDSAANALIKEFDRWCLKKGIGFRGRMFRAAVRMKNVLRKASAFGLSDVRSR
jgi:hypothetical protein